LHAFINHFLNIDCFDTVLIWICTFVCCRIIVATLQI